MMEMKKLTVDSDVISMSGRSIIAAGVLRSILTAQTGDLGSRQPWCTEHLTPDLTRDHQV